MNETEFRSGVLEDGTPLMQEFDFVALAHVTCSPNWHGDMVAKHRFNRALNAAIQALEDLDKVKKTLFYGKDNGLASAGDTNVAPLPALICQSSAMAGDLTRDEAVNYIHGVIGLATEAGELLEAMRDQINGNAPFDRVNLIEEVGDGKWYMALLARIGRFRWGDDERTVIAKLRKRFGDKFSAYFANNRDLDAERLVLETAPLTPKLAEPRADAAFAERSEIIADAFDSVGNKSELAKSPAERQQALPHENIARQSVRREDLP